mmetsp:Transcript_39616/g.91735  ORF Transcript_39616/g.91735 Transcript_39616/m.91735 type:complete len:378 (-) Transcript_39616:1793-2926(-)
MASSAHTAATMMNQSAKMASKQGATRLARAIANGLEPAARRGLVTGANLQPAPLKVEPTAVRCKGMGCVLPAAADIVLRGSEPSDIVRGGASDPPDLPVRVSFRDRPWHPSDCQLAAENALPSRVLRRLCASVRHDEELHALAAARIGRRKTDSRFAERAEALRAANSQPVILSNMARSCPKCHNDRSSMLEQCWRKLTNWAPDPAQFACERSWTGEAAVAHPMRWNEALLRVHPAPCFRTCWTALGTGSITSGGGGAGEAAAAGMRHCSAACDGDDAATARSLPPSPQPPAERRASLQAVLRTPPALWYSREWEAQARPRLLQALNATVSRHLLAPLDWGVFELRRGLSTTHAWPPPLWAADTVRSASKKGSGKWS